jgi:acylglycerol lipase
MFVMYGGRDEIVPRAPIRRFVDGLPAEPMRRRKLAWDENGYHRLLRDLQAPVVIADVASWVLTPAAPLPSGADRTAAEAFLPADGRLSLAGR